MVITVSVQYNGGLSPILHCRPDVVTLGNPFDTMKSFVSTASVPNLLLAFAYVPA